MEQRQIKTPSLSFSEGISYLLGEAIHQGWSPDCSAYGFALEEVLSLRFIPQKNFAHPVQCFRIIEHQTAVKTEWLLDIPALNLSGYIGPLPHFLQREVVNISKNTGTGLDEFIHLFEERLIPHSLNQQFSQDPIAQWNHASKHGSEGQFAEMQRSLGTGLSDFEAPLRRYYSASLKRAHISVSTLEAVLSNHFGHTFKVRPFKGGWIENASPFRLSEKANSLGRKSFAIGKRIFSHNHKIEITCKLDPQKEDEKLKAAFLSHDFKSALRSLCRSLIGIPVSIDFLVEFAPHEKGLILGKGLNSGRRLRRGVRMGGRVDPLSYTKHKILHAECS